MMADGRHLIDFFKLAALGCIDWASIASGRELETIDAAGSSTRLLCATANIADCIIVSITVGKDCIYFWETALFGDAATAKNGAAVVATIFGTRVFNALNRSSTVLNAWPRF